MPRRQRLTVPPRRQVICALREEGFEYVVAPYEADAQLAHLARTGQVAAVATEDSDLAAYLAPVILFKMDAAGAALCLRMEDVFAGRLAEDSDDDGDEVVIVDGAGEGGGHGGGAAVGGLRRGGEADTQKGSPADENRPPRVSAGSNAGASGAGPRLMPVHRSGGAGGSRRDGGGGAGGSESEAEEIEEIPDDPEPEPPAAKWGFPSPILCACLSPVITSLPTNQPRLNPRLLAPAARNTTRRGKGAAARKGGRRGSDAALEVRGGSGGGGGGGGAGSALSFRKFSPGLFLATCVLAGCDFLPNIPGIGIKRAHALALKSRVPERLPVRFNYFFFSGAPPRHAIPSMYFISSRPNPTSHRRSTS